MSHLKSISVHGLRGFAAAQTVDFALPIGELGSGLTVLVGANNAGKSTVIEALRAFANPNKSPSFAQGRRNITAGDQVAITLKDTTGTERTLRSRGLWRE